jgi:hypothetical protein
MSLVAVILSIMFFALIWHDEPARPAVIERRTTKNK